MGWASSYIDQLKQGKTVTFRPRGNSMSGIIESGQQVTVIPLGDKELKTGDVVLCSVYGNQYLHLVKAIQDDRYQIGNNRGYINGWIRRNKIYGVLLE